MNPLCVFHSPSRRAIVDIAIGDRGRYSGKLFSDLQREYPDLVRTTEAEAIAAIEDASITPCVEIAEDSWMDALNTLPPDDWHRHGDWEYFRFSERLCFSVTNIYVRFRDRYFMFADRAERPWPTIQDEVAACIGSSAPAAFIEPVESSPQGTAIGQ